MRLRLGDDIHSIWLSPTRTYHGEVETRPSTQRQTEWQHGTRVRKAQKAALLSKWANERPPALDQILSSRDVARLTRRCRWAVHALTLLGRFPKQQQFHGRAIGWAKHDVLTWLSEEATSHRRRIYLPIESPASQQLLLPIHFPRTRRGRGPCV